MKTGEPLIAHVVGARPNFPKMGPVWRALDARGARQVVIHTGQHYDDAMSASFFRDLQLPQPDVNLEIGSGSQASQTAAVMIALEGTLRDLEPDVVVVYGDVNSTLAAALVCAKSSIPLVHVEAGLRSFDNRMPEEINRRVTDALSNLLLTTSQDGVQNLLNEGADPATIVMVGNPMIDSLLIGTATAREASSSTPSIPAQSSEYAVVTLHRPVNVDSRAAAKRSVEMVRELAALLPVLMPVHPRGRATLVAEGLGGISDVLVLDPLPYLQFVDLVSRAAMVVTDSGGIQEEATMLDVPCLTVRTTTERPITITHGTNRLATFEDVSRMAAGILSKEWQAPERRPPLWDGEAGSRIAATILGYLDNRRAR